MEQGRKEGYKKLLRFGAAAVGVYLGFQYLFPLAAPFLLAFGIVYLLNPWLTRVHARTRIRKEVLLAGILVLSAVQVLTLIWGVLQYGAAWAGRISENWDGICSLVGGQIQIFFGDCCMFVQEHFGVNAGRVEQIVLERVEVLIEELRVEFVPKLVKESWWYGKKLLSAAAFLGVGFIASILLCKDYDSMMGQMEKTESGAFSVRKLLQVMERLIHLIAVYLKAQGMILLSIMAVCCVGLWMGKVGGGIALGILAGALDALPFIGTGIVLLPAAFWQLINGRFWKAAWCVLLYVACVGVREFLEPKLMGKRTGIYPVVMLLSVYAGVKLFGLSGLIKGPLAVVILTELLRGTGRDGEDGKKRAEAENADL